MARRVGGAWRVVTARRGGLRETRPRQCLEQNGKRRGHPHPPLSQWRPLLGSAARGAGPTATATAALPPTGRHHPPSPPPSPRVVQPPSPCPPAPAAAATPLLFILILGIGSVAGHLIFLPPLGRRERAAAAPPEDVAPPRFCGPRRRLDVDGVTLCKTVWWVAVTEGGGSARRRRPGHLAQSGAVSDSVLSAGSCMYAGALQPTRWHGRWPLHCDGPPPSWVGGKGGSAAHVVGREQRCRRGTGGPPPPWGRTRGGGAPALQLSCTCRGEISRTPPPPTLTPRSSPSISSWAFARGLQRSACRESTRIANCALAHEPPGVPGRWL